MYAPINPVHIWLLQLTLDLGCQVQVFIHKVHVCVQLFHVPFSSSVTTFHWNATTSIRMQIITPQLYTDTHNVLSQYGVHQLFLPYRTAPIYSNNVVNYGNNYLWY